MARKIQAAKTLGFFINIIQSLGPICGGEIVSETGPHRLEISAIFTQKAFQPRFLGVLNKQFEREVGTEKFLKSVNLWVFFYVFFLKSMHWKRLALVDWKQAKKM